MSIRPLAVALILALLAVPAVADAKGKARRVEVRYDITKLPHEALEVWINCTHPQTVDTFADLKTCIEDETPKTPVDPKVKEAKAQRQRKLTGTAAAQFEFSDKDKVIFVMLYTANVAKKRHADIVAAITGTGISDKDLDAFKKLVGASTDEKSASLTVTAAGADTAEFAPLTDKAEIGQKITVTFNLKETEKDQGKDVEKTVASSGLLSFLVAGAPRFKLSYGVGFTNAPNPSVAIQKTSTIVSFEKDGKTQQAHEQIVVLKDNEAEAAFIQSLVTFAHVRMFSNVYGSIGLQANQKIFEEPMAGVSYRQTAGNKLAVYISIGALFSRETAISSKNGFSDGYKVDPTRALVVDDIATETKKKLRPFIGITFEFR